MKTRIKIRWTLAIALYCLGALPANAQNASGREGGAGSILLGEIASHLTITIGLISQDCASGDISDQDVCDSARILARTAKRVSIKLSECISFDVHYGKPQMLSDVACGRALEHLVDAWNNGANTITFSEHSWNWLQFTSPEISLHQRLLLVLHEYASIEGHERNDSYGLSSRLLAAVRSNATHWASLISMLPQNRSRLLDKNVALSLSDRELVIASTNLGTLGLCLTAANSSFKEAVTDDYVFTIGRSRFFSENNIFGGGRKLKEQEIASKISERYGNLARFIRDRLNDGSCGY